MIEPIILIVEDDEAIRELYHDALEAAELTTVLASTAAEGVALALERHPKVILMDISLPDQTGHEAVAAIRADDWGKTAKILFLTNRTDPEDVVQAIEQGSEDYIIKAHTEVKEVVNKVRLAMHA